MYKPRSFCGWLALVLASLLSPAHAAPQAGDVVFGTDFEGANPLQNWQGLQGGQTQVEAGNQSLGSLAVESPKNGPGNVKIQIPLDVSKMRGMRLRIGAMVKAQDVVQPPQTYNGVKVMLHYKAPGDEHWIQQNSVYGTFDWKLASFIANVPTDVVSAELVLGLEATTGKAWFDDVKVTVYAPMRQSPATPPTGPVYRGRNLPRLRGVMINPNINEDGLRTLAKWNVNVIRWQLMWNGFPHSPADDGDLAAYGAWLEGALKKMDSMLPLCQELGIMVVVDLHTPPGGRDRENKWPLFQDKRFQDKFIEIWDNMARRYVDNGIIWGYDLVNEPREDKATIPLDKGVMDWHTLATVVAKRVRAIDPGHAIIVAGEDGGNVRGLQYFEPIPVPGIVYTVHMYDPGDFTHQRIPGNHPQIETQYPGVINGTLWDKERLRKSLQPLVQWQRDYNAHIYIGEFSAVRWAKGADKWLQDATELFEEYGWDWSYHAFREYNGWSVEHSDNKDDSAPAKSPTAREMVLRSWFAKNQKPSQAGSKVAASFPRWLVIGDSITAHGPKADLQWGEPTRGMAASKLENDYVHQLQGLLQGLNPKNAQEIKILGRFAKLSAGTIEGINTALDEIKAYDADLVTVQLGENDDIDKIGREEFEKRYRTLIDGLPGTARRTRIVCTGVWSPGTALDPVSLDNYAVGTAARAKDDVIAAICREKGLTFVPVAPFATKPGNSGYGNNPGVRWHPNDAGMRAYAEAIFAAL